MKLIVPLLWRVVEAARGVDVPELQAAIAAVDEADAENERDREERLKCAPKCLECGRQFLAAREEMFCSIGCRLGMVGERVG